MIVDLINTIAVMGILFFFTLSFAFYTTHLIMVEDSSGCDTIQWMTFKGFMKGYKSYQYWVYDNNFKNSSFSSDCTGGKLWYVHAGIIRLNGVGVKLDPISYLLFQHWCVRVLNKGRTKRIGFFSKG